jgi:hypothetical protein
METPARDIHPCRRCLALARHQPERWQSASIPTLKEKYSPLKKIDLDRVNPL